MSMRVFVSSTYTDLRAFREAVHKSLRQLGATGLSMEDWGARDQRPKEECLRIIKQESDLFVGIYAHRYGFIPSGDEISITESEYEAATLRGLTRLIYLVDENVPWKPSDIDRGVAEEKLQRLKNKLKSDHICQFFLNADDLAAKVVSDVGRYISLGRLPELPDISGLMQIPLESAWPANVPPSAAAFEEDKRNVYLQCRDVFLVHVLAPSKVGSNWYDVFLYLSRHGSTSLEDVDYAEFYLGPYWGGEVFQVMNENDRMGMKTAANGSFLCTCRVTFKDGFKAFVYRYVDFEMERVVR